MGEGEFICGRVKGEIVAVAKHTWQRNDVLWLEGLKVHPDHQGKRYARKIVEVQVEYIKEMDHSYVRFFTAADKEPVKKQAEGIGFYVKKEYEYLRFDEEEVEEMKVPVVS